MKELLHTKTFWVAVGAIMAAIAGAATGETTWMQALQPIAIGMLGITGRHAIVKGR